MAGLVRYVLLFIMKLKTRETVAVDTPARLATS